MMDMVHASKGAWVIGLFKGEQLGKEHGMHPLGAQGLGGRCRSDGGGQA